MSRNATEQPEAQTQLSIMSGATADGEPRPPRPAARNTRITAQAPRAASVGTRTPRSGARRPIQPVPRLLLTRKEAAACLGMSLDTFERRVQPVIKLVPCGQLLLVPLRELERWCDEHAHYLAGGV
jgi:hypothetical protein